MPHEIDFSALSILVVDSNLHTLTLTKNVLRTLGSSRVKPAINATVALEQLGTAAHDLAIVDMDFDDCLSGLEVVEIVRSGKDSANPRLPIIVISSSPDRQKVFAARDAGVTEFLRRPFSATELRERIISAVGHTRSFVKSKTFSGPDRRRTRVSDFEGSDRRKQTERDGPGSPQDLETA